MKSNICVIDNGTKDLEAIFKESEKVAVYNELTHKQTLQLRLLCEEVDSMLPNLIDDFCGKLWFDFEDGVCKIYVSIEIKDITLDKKEELINISNNKKNAAAVGIAGKIAEFIDNFFLNEEALAAYSISTGSFNASTAYVDAAPVCGEDALVSFAVSSGSFSAPAGYSYLWRLENYKDSVNKEESEAWDELEKSVIASVADDVIVGVQGKRADIIIVKKFA